jgi:hypothetical protein
MRDDDDNEDRTEDGRFPVRRMFRGDTFVLDPVVLMPPAGSPPGAPPQPTNITGWRVWFTAKRSVVDKDQFAVCQLQLGSTAQGSIVMLNPLIGTIEITMAPIVTRAFPDGRVRLAYDVQVQDLMGRDFTIERGWLDVIPDVTQAI